MNMYWLDDVGDERRIENVKSYVSTEDVGELPYARCNSVGSRPQALQPSPNNIIDQYVEMRRQDLNGQYIYKLYKEMAFSHQLLIVQ